MFILDSKRKKYVVYREDNAHLVNVVASKAVLLEH